MLVFHGIDGTTSKMISKTKLPGNNLRRHFSNRRNVVLAILYLLLFAGSVFRVLYIVEYNPMDQIWSDPKRHWIQGTQVTLDDPMTLTDPILYQVYIAVFAKLSLQIKPLTAFYTIVLALIMPWTWYRFFRELQPSKATAVTGWVALTWLPSWLGIYGYFMQETLMLPMLGLALWMTWRAKRKQTTNAFLIMVLAWTLAGLTRGICIPMAAVATIWIWAAQDNKLKNVVYGLVLLTFILGPLTYRGYEKMGMFAPHGLGYLNMIYAQSGKREVKVRYVRDEAWWEYGFASPSMGIKPLAPISDWSSQRSGLSWNEIRIDHANEDWRRALDNQEMTLDKYLWITKENLIFLFFGESWPDTNRERAIAEVNYQMRWVWAPLIIITFMLLGVFWRSQKQHLLLPSIIVTWLLIQGFIPLVPNEGRYRKPLEGLLIAQLVLMAGTNRQGAQQRFKHDSTVWANQQTL
jgi:hypothetical protein